MRPVRASKAMVVSVHRLAAEAGVAMMKAGGNAIDAAVATGFALAVVHPQAGNLGGGGFMLVRFATGDSHFVDYREKAPAAATRDMYLDAQGKVVPDLSLKGYQASAVPGSVAGLAYAQAKWGKLSFAAVLAPAIRLAREGFILSQEDAEDFRDTDLSQYATSRLIFQRNGKLYRGGELFRQPALARTLTRIAAAPHSFYKGALAREIAAAVQAGGGLITAADLAQYEVKERPPIHGSYRGYEVLSAPPPSSGGIALLELLNILEGWPLDTHGRGSATSMHLTAEAFRRAMFDRAEFLGDPDFNKIPAAQLTDKKYAAAWRESVDPDKASVSQDLERPAGRFNELDQSARQWALAPEAAATTHYSVIDPEGNAVSVTTTLNGTFGSYVTLPGLGFLMNNEMDDFTSKPGTPNYYGLIQGPANAIAPGKRPLSAMTPAIVVKNGKPYLVLGSPGGPRIITTVANILMGVIDYGLDIQQAVNAPRFHHQWLPDHILIEGFGFSPDTLKLLAAKGHTIKVYDETGKLLTATGGVETVHERYWSNGECILIDPKTGERWGATDARANGAAVGF